MQYVATATQIADIFTKALNPVDFIKFGDQLAVSRSKLNIVEKVEKVEKMEKRREPMEKAAAEEPDKKKKRI